MESLLSQITSIFPDIQEADASRILDFLGFSTADIFEPNPSYRLINGESIFVQSCILDDDIERANALLAEKKRITINISVNIVGSDLEYEVTPKADGTEIAFL